LEREFIGKSWYTGECQYKLELFIVKLNIKYATITKYIKKEAIFIVRR
jgi:hypothetical protein